MTPAAIAALLSARQGLAIAPELATHLAAYLDLLLRWNARTNLSAIREPEEIVLRHFGESLQCAEALPAGARSLLDYGSGAGFPGVPCALVRPGLAVTLAESQNKKAAFLQELARVLGPSLSPRVTVHAGRVAALPSPLQFDVVTLRAVDRMREACAEARQRVRPGGRLVLMTTTEAAGYLLLALGDLRWGLPVPLRGSEHGVIAIGRVPE